MKLRFKSEGLPCTVWIAVILILVSFVIPRPASAVTDEDMKKVLEKLDDLTRRNEELYRMNQEMKRRNDELSRRIQVLEDQGKAGKNSTGIANEVAALNEDVEYLSEVMDVVGKKALQDKVQIGLELRTRFDWFDWKNDVTNHEEEVRCLPSNRFRLNLKANITENLKFHGRLSMYKNWNDDTLPTFPFANWANRSRTRTDEDVNVERAYVDYFFSLHDNCIRIESTNDFLRHPAVSYLFESRYLFIQRVYGGKCGGRQCDKDTEDT